MCLNHIRYFFNLFCSFQTTDKFSVNQRGIEEGNKRTKNKERKDEKMFHNFLPFEISLLGNDVHFMKTDATC